jgi:hypothetical protein
MPSRRALASNLPTYKPWLPRLSCSPQPPRRARPRASPSPRQIEWVQVEPHNLPSLPSPLRGVLGFAAAAPLHATEALWSLAPWQWIGERFWADRRAVRARPDLVVACSCGRLIVRPALPSSVRRRCRRLPRPHAAPCPLDPARRAQGVVPGSAGAPMGEAAAAGEGAYPVDPARFDGAIDFASLPFTGRSFGAQKAASKAGELAAAARERAAAAAGAAARAPHLAAEAAGRAADAARGAAANAAETATKVAQAAAQSAKETAEAAAQAVGGTAKAVRGR